MTLPRATCLIALLLALFSHLAIASDGTNTSGGGDANCQEFNDIAGEVTVALAKVGQRNIAAENPLVRLDDLVKIKRALRCVPENGIPRHAISFPAQKLTKLNSEKWARLNKIQKTNLVIHELAVLAQYEQDGEYYISKSIRNVLAEHPNSLSVLLRLSNVTANEVIVNERDGYVTIVDPYVTFSQHPHLKYRIPKREKFSAWEESNAICKYFGLQAGKVGNKISHGNDVLGESLIQGGAFVFIDQSGRIEKVIRPNDKVGNLYKGSEIQTLHCDISNLTRKKPAPLQRETVREDASRAE